MDGMDEEAKLIREKRLAMLSNLQQSTPSIIQAEKPTVPTIGKTSPPKVVVTPKLSTPEVASPVVSSPFKGLTDTQWQDKTLSHIFKISLSQQNTNKDLSCLSSLSQELASEGKNQILLFDDIERIIYSTLSSNIAPNLFEYLVACWKRCVQVLTKLREIAKSCNKETDIVTLCRKREFLVKNVSALIVSYAGLVIMAEMNESFPQSAESRTLGPRIIAKKLLLPHADTVQQELPTEFLSAFVTRYENDGLDQIMEPVLSSLSARMRSDGGITSGWLIPMRALTLLSSLKPIAALIPKLPNFHIPANTPPKTIPLLTFLGPFFGNPVTLPDETDTQKIASTYFPVTGTISNSIHGFDIGARGVADVKSSMGALVAVSINVQRMLYDIVMFIVKSGDDGKQAILKYFADVIMANTGRGKMNVDKRQVSPDGFMYNINAVLYKLVAPIIDTNFSKIHLISPSYLLCSDNLIHIPADETRMNIQKEELEKSISKASNKANFVSDVFYLGLVGNHYGICSLMKDYKDMCKSIEGLQGQVDEMRKQRDSGSVNPLVEMVLKRYESQLDQMVGVKLSFDSVLLDDDITRQYIRFYDLVMMFLIRSIYIGMGKISAEDTSIHWNRFVRGDSPLDLKFANEIPLIFASLPEWILEDICEFYLFVYHNNAKFFERESPEAFITFSMCILNNPGYIKNPYLKSKLVQFLFYLTLPLYRTQNGDPMGRLEHHLLTNPNARKLLIPTIIRFYVDAESTGVHTQFYDKFNIRYNISQILKRCWTDLGHRGKIVEATKDLEFFVKFINLLMNDTTYIFDESLSALIEIRNVQNIKNDAAAWNALTAAEKKEKESILASSERQATNFLALGNQTIHLMNYLTTDEKIRVPFLKPYIVDRLAAMMNYNLAALVGPRCTELKVANPEKYKFNPKKLLNELLNIYINLSSSPEFIAAVAKDGRSYEKRLFERGCSILASSGMLDPSKVQKLSTFISEVEQVVLTDLKDDETFGDDIPDEFLDPVMYSLMKDPVLLPTSNTVVDRSTIYQHLLSDQSDPFNRKALTIEMVIPDTELKKKIEDWTKKMRSGCDKMDIS